jgi:hypothetical protein
MPKYMLLLRDDRELFGKLGPEEMQKTIEKYFAWRNKPFVVDGAGLMEKTGRVMQKKNGSVSVTAGRLAEAEAAFSAALECECADPERRFLQRQLESVRSKWREPHLDKSSSPATPIPGLTQHTPAPKIQTNPS